MEKAIMRVPIKLKIKPDFNISHLIIFTHNEPVEKPPHYDYGVVFGGLLTLPQHEIAIYRAS